MDQTFHQQISRDIGRIEGKLDQALPAQQKMLDRFDEILGKQEIRLKALEEGEIFKKGKVIGISAVTSVITMAIGYFLPK